MKTIDRINQRLQELKQDFKIPTKLYLGRKEFRAVNQEWIWQLKGQAPKVRSVKYMWTREGLVTIVRTKHKSYLRIVSTLEGP